MVSAALLLTAVLQLVCVWLLWTRTTHVARIWLLIIVGAGLAYDSAMVGLGALIGEGALLEALSWPRFFAHALLTPLLIWWAADRVGAPVPWRRAALALTAAMIVWGVVTELPHLNLVVEEYADTLRYAADHPAPPIPALVVTVVLLVAGVLLWRREGVRAPLIGTVLLVLASGAAVAVPPLGNAGEAAMIVALVAAELPARSRREQLAPN